MPSKLTKVSQKKWIKGVNAAAQSFAQPAGSFPRGSNIVYTSRGALKTTDGSKIISAFGGVSPLVFNPPFARTWRELFFFNPANGTLSGDYGLLEDPNTSLSGSVGTPVLTATGTGLTGTFYVKVTALDGVGGESAASPEASITLANQALHVAWSAVTNAFGYNVYVGSSPGAETLALASSASKLSIGPTVQAPTLAFTFDATSIQNPYQTPPTVDTTQQLLFVGIPPQGFSGLNRIFTFPASQQIRRIPTPSSLTGATAPVQTTVQLRPTVFAVGGPVGGAGGFTNPTLAYDNNLTTFAQGKTVGTFDTHEETWSGFSATSGSVVALSLNFNNAIPYYLSPARVSAAYSKDNGVTWINLPVLKGTQPQKTFTVSLPVTQDTTKVKVSAFSGTSSGPKGDGSVEHDVYEIWLSVTTQLSAGSSAIPTGGDIGICSPVPQILQFKDLMVLLLGNGVAPYSSDGTTGNTIKLVNNFQASYASRTNTTPQNVGDQVSITVSGTAYIFTCVQAGTTAGSSPTFSAIQGSITADGTVYWKNTGSIAAVTAPRGAAHGIVYAGSLWVANTFPTTTPDNFDGPSCLKMSDLNNPNSWNPLNVAFLDRDDGTSITGLATFTIAESGIPPVGSLVAFKDFSTFQINGVFGASNFSIQRAQTDMGCIAARSIQFIPGFGIMRLSHLGFAMFDGVRDRLLSEEIRPYLFGGKTDISPIDWSVAYFAKAAQVADPPMYVAACPILGDGSSLLSTLTGVTASLATPSTPTLPGGNYYVVVTARGANGETMVSAELGPYAVVGGTNGLTVNAGTVPTGFSGFRAYFGVTQGAEDQYVDFDTASVTISTPGNPGTVPTGVPGAMTRVFCYDLVLKAWTILDLPFAISVLHQFRSPATQPVTVAGGFYDTTVRRTFQGDTTWDGTTISASVRTPEVFGRQASDRTYFRQLEIRGVGTPATLAVTTTVSGLVGAQRLTRNLTALPMGGGEFVAYADIGLTGVDAHADITWTGPLEVQSVDWACVAKAIRGKVMV